MGSKILCTFVQEQHIDDLVRSIETMYVLQGKVFVLSIDGPEEFVVTYNIDCHNIRSFPLNTILVHRRKQTDTLYTLNALNYLVQQMSGGILDPTFEINWENYRRSLLLIRDSEFRKISTKLYKIYSLEQ